MLTQLYIMKFLCIIMSLYISTLSIDLCCPADDCSDEAASAPMEQHPEEHQDNEPTHCSPFLSCGSGSGFVAQDNEMHGTSWPSEPALGPANILVNSEFNPRIWQPPKLN